MAFAAPAWEKYAPVTVAEVLEVSDGVALTLAEALRLLLLVPVSLGVAVTLAVPAQGREAEVRQWRTNKHEGI